MKIIGITDEVTSCDCCGKSNLKKTVVLEDQEGNINYFGQVCASKAAGWSKEYVKEEVKAIEKTNKQLMKDKKIEIEKFVNTHPLKIERREDLQKLSGVPFKQRIEMGYIQKWADNDQKIKNEIFEVFTDEISLMLFNYENKQYGHLTVSI
jgi:hypothetical protein